MFSEAHGSRRFADSFSSGVARSLLPRFFSGGPLLPPPLASCPSRVDSPGCRGRPVPGATLAADRRSGRCTGALASCSPETLRCGWVGLRVLASDSPALLNSIPRNHTQGLGWRFRPGSGADGPTALGIQRSPVAGPTSRPTSSRLVSTDGRFADGVGDDQVIT